jgi:hypothetical protein
MQWGAANQLVLDGSDWAVAPSPLNMVGCQFVTLVGPFLGAS